MAEDVGDALGQERKESGGAPTRVSSLWWGYFPVFLVALFGLITTLYFFRQVTSWESLGG